MAWTVAVISAEVDQQNNTHRCNTIRHVICIEIITQSFAIAATNRNDSDVNKKIIDRLN